MTYYPTRAIASLYKYCKLVLILIIGENFAIFRSSNGNINILDAYCPHLGANMAIGGIVRGNNLQCPFHGWTFDGTNGQCVNKMQQNDCPDGRYT